MRTKILFVGLIFLGMIALSHAQDPRGNWQKVEFVSTLIDANYNSPVWVLKFENGATLWVTRDPAMEKGLSMVWWIGKKYHVKYKPFYGYVIKVSVQEKN